MARQLAVSCDVIVSLPEFSLQIVVQFPTFCSLVEKGMIKVDGIVEDVLRVPIFGFSMEKEPHELDRVIVSRVWVMDRIPAAVELFG